jgi:hypothetical protein
MATGCGYAGLLLPDHQVWRGFYLQPVASTSGFVALMRALVPPNLAKNASVDPSTAELGLSAGDLALIGVLAAMMVHDAFDLDLTRVLLSASGIAQVSGLDFFWVEGWDADGRINTSFGPLDADSVDEAIFAAAYMGLQRGCSMYPD